MQYNINKRMNHVCTHTYMSENMPKFGLIHHKSQMTDVLYCPQEVQNPHGKAPMWTLSCLDKPIKTPGTVCDLSAIYYGWMFFGQDILYTFAV